MLKKVLIGKLGKSLKFKKHQWRLNGGDEGAINLIKLLSLNNPDIKFYLGGISDYCSLSKEERNDMQNVFQIPFDRYNYKSQYDYCLDNKLKFDVGLIINGLSYRTSLPNVVPKVNGDGFAIPLQAAEKYCGSLIHLLNKTQIPFITCSEDPRNTRIRSADLFNVERKCLSLQRPNFYIRNHIKDYQKTHEIIGEVIPIDYCNLDLSHLFNKDRDRSKVSPRLNNYDILNIFMNKFGLTSKKTRKPFLEEYIFYNFPKANIYGKWDEEIKNNEKRYINKKIAEIPDILYRTKYTVIKSLKRNFISCKPWEMLHFGILPFLSPDYDGDKLLPFPEFLYLDSPEDLLNKISYLESNESEYLKLWKECQLLLKPEYYSGEFLSTKLIKELEDTYISV